MKWMISQPMNGRTDEEILTQKEAAIKKIKALFGFKAGDPN